MSVTSPVTFTMNNLINAGVGERRARSMSASTPAVKYVAGTYSVNGATVTFTPLSPHTQPIRRWTCVSTD